MRTLTLALLLAIASCQMPLRSALGETAEEGRAAYCATRKELNWCVTAAPVPRPVAPTEKPGSIDATIPTVGVVKPVIRVINDEPGGLYFEHMHRFISWKQSGSNIEIRGACSSACTLVMSYIPREKICFSHFSSLNFHWLRNGADNTPNRDLTVWMIGGYPPDIQAWLAAKGGINALPHGIPWTRYWTLSARELWKMGYRKCDAP